MAYWFFTPIPNYFWFTTTPLSVQSDTEAVVDTPNTNSNQPEQVKRQLRLNISRQDLERAGYNHKRSSWSELEDKKLLELAKSQNLNWNEIGKKMENRNSKMCYSRYRRLCYQTKKRWTTKEESLILDQIQNLGFNWKLIAKSVPGRTPRQIEQHYHFCLRPDINKSEWTLEQDLQLVELLELHGTNWKKLQQQMNGRSENQIKNRYFGRLLKIVAEKQKNATTEDANLKN